MKVSPIELPHAHGGPGASGAIRSTPEDFQVDEELGFEPSGAGEHALLKLRKRNANTEFVARAVARCAGVPVRDVSYAGLKDRAAVATQWFSVHLAWRPEPDWSTIASAEIQILEVARHRRKLRRGALHGNRFTITLRDLAGDPAALDSRLRQIQAQGAPNYFGEQRFGRENLARAVAMLEGRHTVRDRFQRGMYLSALRSELFNRVLAARVAAGNWCRGLDGEAMMLAGSRSFFVAEKMDEGLTQRLAAHDLHPTGPLWGKGQLHSRAEARAWEENALAADRAWCEALARAGLEMDRRALRLSVKDLAWEMGGGAMTLHFSLPAGCHGGVARSGELHQRHA